MFQKLISLIFLGIHHLISIHIIKDHIIFLKKNPTYRTCHRQLLSDAWQQKMMDTSLHPPIIFVSRDPNRKYLSESSLNTYEPESRACAKVRVDTLLAVFNSFNITQHHTRVKYFLFYFFIKCVTLFISDILTDIHVFFKEVFIIWIHVS